MRDARDWAISSERSSTARERALIHVLLESVGARPNQVPPVQKLGSSATFLFCSYLCSGSAVTVAWFNLCQTGGDERSSGHD